MSVNAPDTTIQQGDTFERTLTIRNLKTKQLIDFVGLGYGAKAEIRTGRSPSAKVLARLSSETDGGITFPSSGVLALSVASNLTSNFPSSVHLQVKVVKDDYEKTVLRQKLILDPGGA